MTMDYIKVTMTECPTEKDWYEVKRRALVTMGYTKVLTPPDEAWKHRMLEARHSPIRRLRFSFVQGENVEKRIKIDGKYIND